MRKTALAAWPLGLLLLTAPWSRLALADDDGQPHVDAEKYHALLKQADLKERELDREIHRETQEQIKVVQARLEDVRQWDRQQFELGERKLIDRPRIMPKLMKQWQDQREKEIYRLLQFPEKSSGSIESGRALNAMLESVGAAALQNAEMRRVKPEMAIPLTEPDELLAVEKRLADEITLQDNTLGAKICFQGSRELLDLDWPPVLREDRWKEYRAEFEEARKSALAEVALSGYVSDGTDHRLRAAVQKLNRDFTDYRKDWFQGEHVEVNRAMEVNRLFDGSRHIEKLVMGAGKVAELTPEQVSYRELFQGGSIEDWLAFLRRNNLRIAGAAPAHRSAYYKLFSMMVRYYLDEKMAINIQRNLERELSGELARLNQNDQHAIDAALGRTMSASDQAAVFVSAMGAITAMAQK